jgi:hypothetical protein
MSKRYACSSRESITSPLFVRGDLNHIGSCGRNFRAQGRLRAVDHSVQVRIGPPSPDAARQRGVCSTRPRQAQVRLPRCNSRKGRPVEIARISTIVVIHGRVFCAAYRTAIDFEAQQRPYGPDLPKGFGRTTASAPDTHIQAGRRADRRDNITEIQRPAVPAGTPSEQTIDPARQPHIQKQRPFIPAADQ